MFCRRQDASVRFFIEAQRRVPPDGPMTENPDIMLKPKKGLHIFGLILTLTGLIAFIRLGLSGERLGYLMAGFFAIGLLMTILMILPGARGLHLAADGFTIRTLFRKMHVPWSDVEEFIVDSRTRGVGFNFRPGRLKPPWGNPVIRSAFGCDGIIPETYGYAPRDLADLLNQYRLGANPENLET